MKNKMNIPLVDLKTPLKLYGPAYKEITAKVIDSLQYIGMENNQYIEELSETLSHFLGGVYALPCSSGTMALLIALLAIDIKPGDEVILPDFNFIAGAEVVTLLGARPILLGVDPKTYLIDFEQIKKRLIQKNNIKAIIVTDLFGQFPNYRELWKIVSRYNITIIEDGAQSLGAYNTGETLDRACTLGHISTTSFYPAKPLGALGEGGAVFSNDSVFFGKMCKIINHGMYQPYVYGLLGFNGRLNGIQAALINFKLKRRFEIELNRRNEIANLYYKNLPKCILPEKINTFPSWAQFTIRIFNRTAFIKFMKNNGIGTGVYYPKLISSYDMYKFDNVCDRTMESLCNSVISIPIHPYMTNENVLYVCERINYFINGGYLQYE